MSVEGFAEPPAPSYAPGLVDGRQSETALFIARGLRRMLRAYGYSTLTELPLLDGRRADVVALRGDGAILIVEIKSSIADFRADNKWRDYLGHCDKLYFAICDAIPPEMMPLEAGLIGRRRLWRGDRPRSAGAKAGAGDATGGAAALCPGGGGSAAPAGGPWWDRWRVEPLSRRRERGAHAAQRSSGTASRSSCKIISTSRATAGSGDSSARCKAKPSAGTGGSPASPTLSALTLAGRPISVLNAIPSPAAVAAHWPARLGVSNATRQGMPARSSALVATERSRHGASRAASGSGSPDSGRQTDVPTRRPDPAHGDVGDPLAMREDRPHHSRPTPDRAGPTLTRSTSSALRAMHASIDKAGVALGAADLVRVSAEAEGRRQCEVRSRSGLGRVLSMAYGPQPEQMIVRVHRGLNRAALAFEAGDFCLAGIETVLLGLPDPTPSALAKLAEAAKLEKWATGWESQPRVPAGQTDGGQWTTEDGVGARARCEIGDARLPSPLCVQPKADPPAGRRRLPTWDRHAARHPHGRRRRGGKLPPNERAAAGLPRVARGRFPGLWKHARLGRSLGAY